MRSRFRFGPLREPRGSNLCHRSPPQRSVGQSRTACGNDDQPPAGHGRPEATAREPVRRWVEIAERARARRLPEYAYRWPVRCRRNGSERPPRGVGAPRPRPGQGTNVRPCRLPRTRSTVCPNADSACPPPESQPAAGLPIAGQGFHSLFAFAPRVGSALGHGCQDANRNRKGYYTASSRGYQR